MRTSPDLERSVPMWCIGLVAAVGVLITLFFGCWHISHPVLLDHDTRFWFVGGAAWWEGVSPYDHAAFVEIWSRDFPPHFVEDAAFVYPGTILPLSLGLGALPWDVARFAMRGLNLLAYAGVLVVLWDLLARRMSTPVSPTVRALFVALAAAVPAAALTVTQGQLSLLVALGVCLTWWGLDRRRTVWVVIGVLLASLKLQASLPILAFLTARHLDRRMLWALFWTAGTGLAVLLWTTPTELIADLSGSLEAHLRQAYNQPTHYDSMPALAARVGAGRALQLGGVLAGVGLALWLGTLARRSDNDLVRLRLLQLVVALTAALMPIHRYDLAIDVILLATAWTVGSRTRAALLVGLVILHGRSFWIARHLRYRLHIDMESLDFYAATSSVLAGAVLALLLAFWWRDRSEAAVASART